MVDKVSQDVVTTVQASLGSAVVGDRVAVPPSPIPVVLTRKPTIMELRRLRRQFVKMTQGQTAAPSRGISLPSIAKSFVEYVNSSLQ